MKTSKMTTYDAWEESEKSGLKLYDQLDDEQEAEEAK